MSIKIINSLTNVWNQGFSTNNYSCLDCVVGKYGVYVFRDSTNGNSLYIGEAREQDLKTRIKQNFTEKDTGGTFRTNYMEDENVCFEEFKSFIKNKQIIIFTSEQNIIIRALESILIHTLKPKYNKDT